MAGRQVDHALDDDPVGAGAHEAGVAAPAEQQAEPGDDHGLARAGLAGEHGEPGVERQHRLVDDPEVADADLLDHARRVPVGVGHHRAGRAAPALHREAELLDEPVGEAAVRQAGQPHRLVGAVHLDARARGQVDGAPPVAPHDAGALGAGQHLDDEAGLRADDHRPGEQGVRADRHEEQGLDVGPDDRAAGRERVGGGPGGGGHDDAVAAPGRQRAAVDLDGELEHPLARRLLDGHLVQGPGREHRVAVLEGVHLEGHPLLDGVVARDDALDGGVEVFALGLGEEADVAEVDPEQGHARAAGELGAAQDRAVAAEHADQLAAGGAESGPSEASPAADASTPATAASGVSTSSSGGAQTPTPEAMQAGGDVGGQLLGLGPADVGDEQDAARRRRSSSSSSARWVRGGLAHGVADPVLAHCVRRHRPRPQEVLGVAARAADRAGRGCRARAGRAPPPPRRPARGRGCGPWGR